MKLVCSELVRVEIYERPPETEPLKNSDSDWYLDFHFQENNIKTLGTVYVLLYWKNTKFVSEVPQSFLSFYDYTATLNFGRKLNFLIAANAWLSLLPKFVLDKREPNSCKLSQLISTIDFS